MWKGIMENFTLWAGEKTKPIQSQTKPNLFSPQIYLGIEDWVEKTKPICWSSNLHNVSNGNGLWGFRRLEAAWKQSQFKPNQSQSPEFGARQAVAKSMGFDGGASKSQRPVGYLSGRDPAFAHVTGYSVIRSGAVRQHFARKICQKQAFWLVKVVYIDV